MNILSYFFGKSDSSKEDSDKLSALTDLMKVNHRQLALSIITCLLSDLVYMECDQMFYTDVVLSLGLTIKKCYTSNKNMKFMVISKGSREELSDIDRFKESTSETLEDEQKKIKKREKLLKDEGKMSNLIEKNILGRLVKRGKINEEFLKPYYSPKLNQIITNYLSFSQKSHLKDLITEDDLFIVFRGTANKDNILSDLDIPTIISSINHKNGGLHSGFVKAYQSGLDELEPVIQAYIDKKNIIFTGHSLGGALASLASIDFTHKLSKYSETHSIGLITFGAPRVTDKEGSDYFTKLLLDTDNPLKYNLRICNALDPVVYFKPPHILTKTKYRHLMSLIQIEDKPTKYTSIVFPLNTQHLTLKIFSFYQDRYKSGKEEDKSSFIDTFGKHIITHFMGNYIINLLNHLPKDIYRNDNKIKISIDNLNKALE